MKKLRKSIEEMPLEGSGGGSGGGSGASGYSMMGQAARNSIKNKTDVDAEYAKLQRQLQTKNEINAAKAKPERQAAESKAVVTQEDGVKKTVYPYVGPNEFKKGGMVGSASKRADGIAQRGKTRGKMI